MTQRPASFHPFLYRCVKRAIDIGLSLPACLLLALAFPAIALLIRLDSSGPVIFGQQRYGYRKRPFTIYKFRTLHQGCSHATGGDQIASNDQRVTRIGRLLRRWSLDETPQLYNILKGEMSFVGPRPHAIDHHDYYSAHIRHFGQRLAARPGLTGLAQINGWRGATPDLYHMAQRLHYDQIYIARRSCGLDLSILFKTLFAGSWHEKIAQL